MLGIFPLGPKQVFFRLLSPFFGYIVTAMLPQKRKNRRKNPLFLAPAENPQHALKISYKGRKYCRFWLYLVLILRSSIPSTAKYSYFAPQKTLK
jgi:hypothetical protein